MYSCGPLHMDEPKQDDMLDPTYSSSVPIRDVVPKNYRKRWTIGSVGERESGISVLRARHDDDDDDLLNFKSNSYGLFKAKKCFINVVSPLYRNESSISAQPRSIQVRNPVMFQINTFKETYEPTYVCSF